MYSSFSHISPSALIAPKPDSLFQGSRILLTTSRSSGSSSLRAISAATGTPPAGMAITMASLPRHFASILASTAPACRRSRNTPVRSLSSGRSWIGAVSVSTTEKGSSHRWVGAAGMGLFIDLLGLGGTLGGRVGLEPLQFDGQAGVHTDAVGSLPDSSERIFHFT